jgi:hypothetical protein
MWRCGGLGGAVGGVGGQPNSCQADAAGGQWEGPFVLLQHLLQMMATAAAAPQQRSSPTGGSATHTSCFSSPPCCCRSATSRWRTTSLSSPSLQCMCPTQQAATRSGASARRSAPSWRGGLKAARGPGGACCPPACAAIGRDLARRCCDSSSSTPARTAAGCEQLACCCRSAGCLHSRSGWRDGTQARVWSAECKVELTSSRVLSRVPLLQADQLHHDARPQQRQEAAGCE